MTTISTDVSSICDIVEWLLAHHRPEDGPDPWSNPTFVTPELPWPPGIGEIMRKHDPTMKNLGPTVASIEIHDDALAALVKLQFADVLYN
jgi:hypothetical protein